MLKKMKRLFTLIMVVSMVMSLFSTAAFAAEGEQDLYIYKYDGTRYVHDGVAQDSSYLVEFRWMNGDNAIENWRSYDISSGLFNLVTTDGSGQSFAAYCADFLTSAVAETTYKRINLEDAGYFSEGSAAHIRGILNNGYWYDWTEADLAAAEAAANAWNAAYQGGTIFGYDVPVPGDFEEEVGVISGLTRDEAMTATQLAIWAFANTEADNYWMDFRPYEAADGEDLSTNIKAFRKYLVHQAAEAPGAGSILFSDEVVSSNAVFTTSGEGISYDVTIYFKLKGDVAESIDNLTLTAVLGAGTEGEQSFTAPLTGAGALAADENDNYRITFTGVTEAGEINLKVSGTQNVSDVYFYAAKPETESQRDQSQNLVGFAEGTTPVAAQSSVKYDLGQTQSELFKYDAAQVLENGENGGIQAGESWYAPLAGAEFNLYAKVGFTEYLVKSGLVSDEDGYISVSGLADGYEYYFREVKAPEGYKLNEENHNSGAVVGNEKILFTDVNVMKIWAGDTEEVRPVEISVNLLKNGITEDTQVLSAANQWYYCWRDLSIEDNWTVEEAAVPENYEASCIEAENNSWVITNTYKAPENPVDPTDPVDPVDPVDPYIPPYIPDVPDVPDIPDIPVEPEEPVVPVEEPEVPLANAPDEEELVIVEEEVPLANVPATGSTSWIWYSLTLISGLALAVMKLIDRKARD